MQEKYDNQLKDLGNEFIGIKLLNSEETDIFKIQYENGQIIPEFLIRLQIMPDVFIEDEDRLIVNQFAINKRTKQIIQTFEKQPSALCLINSNHLVLGFRERSQVSYYIYDGEKYNKECNFQVIGGSYGYNVLKVCKNPFMEYTDLKNITLFTLTAHSLKPTLFRICINFIDQKIVSKQKLCFKTLDVKFLDDTHLVSIERFEFCLLNYHTGEVLSSVDISSYQHIIIPTNFNLKFCPYLLNFDNKTQFINIIDIMNSGYQGKYNFAQERIMQIKVLQNYEGLKFNKAMNTGEDDDSIILLGIDEDGLLKTYRLTIQF
ncbi:hypothetical protein OXYTRIMIC_654 [Oxytricha trifallax]|uniref:Uncharacterized protein n=1 Tax=Oxytricha trifallax TaxID=1172189 RepID=A0A073HYQ1_9SPIT|nr:hypothetical protein OXYTRIMIC_654 [Oxytricha trifallax]